MLCACLPCLAFAIAFLGLVSLKRQCGGRYRARLQEGMDVTADFRELMQCLVQGPALAMRCSDFVPELPVGLQKLRGVDSAKP